MAIMDTEILRLFVSSCEIGSLLQVAHRENLSAPTLTRKIKQLESEMGVPLLKRGRKGVQPTPEGLLLLEKSTTLLGLIDGLHDLLPAHNKKRSGVVTIIGSFSMTAGRLLDDIQTFLSLEENKDVQINLKEADKQTIVDTVRSGHAAIGVFWDATETGGLQTFPYGNDTAACVVHKSHPLANREQLSYKEMARYQTVRTKTTRLVEVMLERSGSIDAMTQNNRVEVPTFEALLRLVGTGHYAGICPKEVANLYAEFFDLKIIPLSDRWANRRHVIGCINSAALTSAARGLLEHLRAQAMPNHLNLTAP
jgi:DNA-binding transcriptional LysR family regulator